ncbi:10436_t:CDS:1, partial [Ambispora leptoticha]
METEENEETFFSNLLLYFQEIKNSSLDEDKLEKKLVDWLKLHNKDVIDVVKPLSAKKRLSPQYYTLSAYLDEISYKSKVIRGKRDLTKILAFYKHGAKHNDAFAQFRIGKFYYERNMKPLLVDYWLSKASKNGNVQAQYLLGMRLFKTNLASSKPNDRDKKMMIYWLKKAADAGYHAAQNKLGRLCHSSELDFCGNLTNAFCWHYRAAKGGFINSQVCVANFFRHGIGIERDFHEAIKWYIAANRSSPVLARYYME